MGTWTKDSQGVWTLSGDGTRTTVTTDEPVPSDVAIRLQCNEISDEVAVVVRSSPDGRSCWEVAIEGTDLLIRRVVYGVPLDPDVRVAHNIPQGTAYLIEARIVQNDLRALINGTQLANFDISSHYANFNRAGFSGIKNGATVSLFQRCELVPIVSERADVLVAVANGDIWCSLDGSSLTLVQAGAMRSTGTVDIAEYRGKAYLVDGSRAKIFDPTDLSVVDWKPTAGTLPGQTGDGTTTAKIVAAHRGRLFLAGADDDPQNLWASAVGDPLDWDTTATTAGRAFVLGGAGGSQSPRVGQPITALQVSSGNDLVVGCVGQIWRLLGDPALGPIETSTISLEYGISGKDALAQVSEGVIIGHAPEGVVLISNGVINLSQNVLTEGIQIPRKNQALYRIQVVRDPTRHGTHIFLTYETQPSSGTSLHFWYDDRAGGLNPGAGGFFPEQYPNNIGPMATVLWRGEVLLGGRDGYIRGYDDTVKSDDGTNAIDSYFTSTWSLPDTIGDTIHEKSFIELGMDSDPVTITIYGGRSIEEAHDSTRRFRLSSVKTVSYAGTPLVDRVRAPAMVMQVRNNTLDKWIHVERIETHLRAGRHKRRWGKPVAPAPPPPPGISGIPGDSVSMPQSSSAVVVSSGPDDTSGQASPASSSQSQPYSGILRLYDHAELRASGTTAWIWLEKKYSGGTLVSQHTTSIPTSYPAKGYTYGGTYIDLNTASSGTVSWSTAPDVATTYGGTHSTVPYSGTYRSPLAGAQWLEQYWSSGTLVSQHTTSVSTSEPRSGFTYGGQP